MPEMISTAPHEYGGRPLLVGDIFDAEAPHVPLLEHLGRARAHVRAPVELAAPAAAASQPARRSQGAQSRRARARAA